jgi:hypothetical protein
MHSQQLKTKRATISVWKFTCPEEVEEDTIVRMKESRTAMRITSIAVTALILLSTFAAAQEVYCDYTKADFAHLKTYAWTSGHPVADELANQSILSSIDAQLSTKGLKKVSPGENPDVLVSYSVVFDSDVRRMGFRDGLRNLRWGSGGPKYVLVGMLVVSLVSADNGTMVWRGTATGDVDAKARPEKRDKKINDITQKIFRNYPPPKQ